MEQKGIRLTGLAPSPGETAALGFAISAEWMKGQVVLRCPETLSSSMGLHFIDHIRKDMPQLSPLSQPIAWRMEPKRGILAYTARTEEGITFEGTAEAASDGAWITLRVKNGSKEPLNSVACQMCLSLSAAPQFAAKSDLSHSFTWIGGYKTSLDTLTPTSNEKGRIPWLLIPTEAMRRKYTGPNECSDGWWVVNQNADFPLLARIAADGSGLVGIAWHDPAAMLMTNTAIPCLHAGPSNEFFLNPGEEGIWRGKVYLTRNSPDRLLSQYRIDEAEKFVRHDLVVTRAEAPE